MLLRLDEALTRDAALAHSSLATFCAPPGQPELFDATIEENIAYGYNKSLDKGCVQCFGGHRAPLIEQPTRLDVLLSVPTL